MSEHDWQRTYGHRYCPKCGQYETTAVNPCRQPVTPSQPQDAMPEVPKHDCEFLTDPERGRCEMHEMFAAGYEAGLRSSPATTAPDAVSDAEVSALEGRLNGWTSQSGDEFDALDHFDRLARDAIALLRRRTAGARQLPKPRAWVVTDGRGRSLKWVSSGKPDDTPLYDLAAPPAAGAAP